MTICRMSLLDLCSFVCIFFTDYLSVWVGLGVLLGLYWLRINVNPLFVLIKQ